MLVAISYLALSTSTPHITVSQTLNKYQSCCSQCLCRASLNTSFRLQSSVFSNPNCRIVAVFALMWNLRFTIKNRWIMLEMLTHNLVFRFIKDFACKRCKTFYESTLDATLLHSNDGYCDNFMSIKVSAEVLIMCLNSLLN